MPTALWTSLLSPFPLLASLSPGDEQPMDPGCPARSRDQRSWWGAGCCCETQEKSSPCPRTSALGPRDLRAAAAFESFIDA